MSPTAKATQPGRADRRLWVPQIALFLILGHMLLPVSAQVHPGNVSGTIVDARGAPVAGAKLNFILVDNQSGKPLTLNVNKKGKFSHAFFPSGTYRVELEGSELFLKSMLFVMKNADGQELERAELVAHPKEGLRVIRVAPSRRVELSLVAASAELRADLAQQTARIEVGGELRKISDLYSDGDMEGVLKETDKILTKEPDLGAALYLRGAALWKLGRLDEAEDHLARAVEFAPDEEGIWGVRGTVLLERSTRLQAGGDTAGAESDAAAAVACFEQDLERDPDSVRSRINRAAALDRAGRTAELEPALRAVLDVEPGNVLARTRLSTLLTQSGRLDDALDLLRGGGESHRDLAVAAFNVAVILYNDGKLEQALAAANRSVEIDPAVPEVHRLLSRIHLGLSNDAAAITEIEQYLELDGEGPDAQVERDLLDALLRKTAPPGSR